MPKRLLTLDDLYEYYASKGRSVHFNAKDDGDQIVVRVPGKLVFENENNPTEGLLGVTVRVCHTGKNLNKSFISEEAMTAALPSLFNRPILAYIYKDEDGNPQFRDHAMHMEDGELVYDEVPIGVFPESCNARLEYDEENDKTYVVADGYIYESYNEAREILERDGDADISCELSIRELSFNAKEKVMNLDNFYFEGATALGVWEDGTSVDPAMPGSNIRISDFKKRNNATFSQENLIEILNEINSKIDQMSINNDGGKEETSQMTKFEELLAKYNKTAEDVTFEYAELDDEALEAAFAEAFGEEETTTPDANAEEKFTKTFELSHGDIRVALYALISQYEEADNEWYMISQVYDDHFVYEGFFDPNNIFDQKYTKDGDNIQLAEERTHMNRQFVTDDELAKLNEMRSNYTQFEEMAAKLAKYEAEPEKIALLESESYDGIKSTEEYAALAQRDAYFNLETADLEAKLNDILLTYAKQHKLDFSAKTTPEDKPKIGAAPIMSEKIKVTKNYGSLFDNI